MRDTDTPEEETEHPMPVNPRTHPQEAVDALEEEVLGEVTDQGGDAREHAHDDEPAHEQDIDLDREPTGEGHTNPESPG